MDKFGSIVVVRTNSDADDFWKLIPTTDSEYWPVISVDFNGVLDIYGGWDWFKPMLRRYHLYNEPTFTQHPAAPGVIEFLEELSEMYNTILLSTATRPLDYAIEWLLWHGLDYYVDFATNFKLPCVKHIDDQVIHHCGDFEKTLKELKNV